MSEHTLPKDAVIGGVSEAAHAAPTTDSEPKATNGTKDTAAVKTIIPGVKLRRPELVHGATTGESVTLNTFPEDRTREKTGLEVDIRHETVEKYNIFLTNFVTDHNKMAEKPAPAGSTAANLLDHVMQDPRRRSIKLVMDQLSQVTAGADGITVTRTINESALKGFLGEGKENNWAVATALMEQEALDGMMAAGLEATINEPYYNRRSRISTDGESSAVIDKIPTARRIGKTALSKAVVGALAAGYFAIGRGTTEIDTKSDIELMDMLKRNSSPADLAYLEAKTGIDLTRINIMAPPNPGGKWAVDFIGDYRPVARDNHDRIVNNIAARKDFLSQLGIDESPTRRGGIVIDRGVDISFPEEFIFDDNEDQEGISVRYSMDIMKEYNRIAGASTDKYVRLSAMGQAREIVMVRYLEKQAAIEKTGEHKENITALDTKKKGMETNADELIKEKKNELIEAREKAARKKTEAEARKTELVDPLPERVQTVQALEAQMLREFDLPIGGNFEAEVADKIDQLRSELQAAKGELKTARGNKATALARHAVGLTETLKEHSAAIKALAAKMESGGKVSGGAGGAGGAATEKGGGDRTTINLPQPPNVDELLKKLTEAENTRHDGTIKDAEDDLKEIKAELDRLEGRQREYQQAIYEREMATLTIASREPGQLKASADAFKTFTAGRSRLCTVSELETLTVDKLAEKLPAAITDPEERVRLALLAKSEAKGRQESVPDYQKDALAEVTDPSTGISADDLFRSINELGAILLTAKPTMDPGEAREKLLSARMAAERMLQVRYAAKNKAEIEHYEKFIKDTDKAVEKLTDFKEQVAELDVTIKVMKGQGDVFSRGSEKVDDAGEMEKLSSDEKVASDDLTYSESEREAGLEKGYYEWLKLLHPDYITATNRNEIFEAMHRVLPPQKLAEILNDSLALGFVGSFQLDEVLNEIHPLSRRLNGPDLQIATKQIINHMRDHGLAL